mgnify:CR=1 FL=1|jgi:hypothetical protein
MIKSKSGEQSVRNDTYHRFEVGTKGGHPIVIILPGLNDYFFKVDELLANRQVSYEEESIIEKNYGKVF